MQGSQTDEEPRYEAAAEHVSPAAAASPDKVSFEAWWMLFVLFLFYVFSLFDRLVLTMLVEPIKADLGLSDVQMSIILGPAFAIFYGLFGWPLGWAADRYPRRWVIYFGVSFWSIAAAASGLARSFTELLLCRIGVGVGEASLTPSAYSLMGDKFPRRRLTTAMSLYQTGSMVGSASAFAVGGLAIGAAAYFTHIEFPLVGQLKAWQLTLIVTGAPSILLALLVFTFSEPPRRKALVETANPEARRNILQFLWAERRLMFPMAMGFSFMVVVGNSLVAWVPAYISREFGMPPEHYGPILGLISIATGSTMVLKGWVVDWLYARGMKDAHLRFYTWLVVASLPTAVAAFLVPNALGFLVLYGILQVLVIQFVVYVAATIHLVTPSNLRAQVIAIFISIFSFIGNGLGPLFTAMITDYVFGDDAKIGMSLLIISAVSIPLAWIFLRISLSVVGVAMARQDGE